MSLRIFCSCSETFWTLAVEGQHTIPESCLLPQNLLPVLTDQFPVIVALSDFSLPSQSQVCSTDVIVVVVAAAAALPWSDIPPNTIQRNILEENVPGRFLHNLPTPFLGGHPSAFCLYLRRDHLTVTLSHPQIILRSSSCSAVNKEQQLNALPAGVILRGAGTLPDFNILHEEHSTIPSAISTAPSPKKDYTQK